MPLEPVLPTLVVLRRLGGLLLAGVLLGAGLIGAFPEAAGVPGGMPSAPRPSVTITPVPSSLSPPDPSSAPSASSPSPPNPSSAASSSPAASAPASPATSSPGTVPPPAGPSPRPTAAAADPSLAGVRDRLALVLRRGRYGDRVAVSVLDVDGAAVFGRRARRPLLPASTLKLVTAAAALARLGPEFRYTTSVNAVRPPTRRGVVHGDLVLVGGADPTLGTPAFGRVEPDRPRTPLEDLATRVRAAGVRRVTGRLVADPTVLAPQPLAAGWLPGYLDDLDTTRASGLTVDAGRLLFRTDAGLQGRAALDPAAVAGRAFHALLRRRGVDIAGHSVVATRPRAEAALAQVRSAPLRTIVRYMTSRSDNHLADGVFRTLGAVGGTPTWAGSARVARRSLRGLDLLWAGSVLADGSGLSRDDRLSAGLLVRLQAGMWTSNLARPWREVMALAGRRGTLAGRLVGTVAERRLYGKTGTLSDVRSLVGTVVGPGDSAWHLAVIGNGLTTAQRERLSSTTDRLVLVLARELHGCPLVQRAGQRPPRRERCPA